MPGAAALIFAIFSAAPIVGPGAYAAMECQPDALGALRCTRYAFVFARRQGQLFCDVTVETPYYMQRFVTRAEEARGAVALHFVSQPGAIKRRGGPGHEVSHHFRAGEVLVFIDRGAPSAEGRASSAEGRTATLRVRFAALPALGQARELPLLTFRK